MKRPRLGVRELKAWKVSGRLEVWEGEGRFYGQKVNGDDWVPIGTKSR